MPVGWSEADGSRHATAMSLGHRPTFYDRPQGAPLLECHLLDFSGDLYDEAVRVRVRGAAARRGALRRVDALVAQMHRTWSRPGPARLT
jgi:riboflavin kinase / FMN adenylyltransferase